MMNPLKGVKAVKEFFGLLDQVNTAIQELRPDLSPAECKGLTVRIIKEMVKIVVADPDLPQERVMAQLQDEFGLELLGATNA